MNGRLATMIHHAVGGPDRPTLGTLMIVPSVQAIDPAMAVTYRLAN
jgi:hypothetical protein